MFGFVPALQSSRVDLVSVINEDASPRGAARGRLRAGLVVAQVAVSLLLLVGAGLATRSVEAARRANPGFDASHVTAIALDVSQNGYDEARGPRLLSPPARRGACRSPASNRRRSRPTRRWRFLDTPAQRVAIEGYEAASRRRSGVHVEQPSAPDYFRTLRIPLMAGPRVRRRDDETDAAPVAVVNNTLAQRFWGGAAARDWQADPASATATGARSIGVAADVKYLRINEAPRPYVYLPFCRRTAASMTLHTRGAAPVDVARRPGARARRGARRRSADSVREAAGRPDRAAR